MSASIASIPFGNVVLSPVAAPDAAKVQPSATAPPPASSPTVARVFALYMQHAQRELGTRTFADAQFIIRIFGEAYGGRRVADLRPFDLQEWLASRGDVKSEWTRRRYVGTLKRALNWGVEMELIDRNPFGRFRSRGRLPTQRTPMADDHFQMLMRLAPPAYRRLFLFLKFTGARPGEASAMTWADVRLDEKCVVLLDHKTAGKTGMPRIIPLVPSVLKMLAWMRQRRQTSTVGLLERLLLSADGPIKSRDLARFMSHYGVSDRGVAKARETLGVMRERIGGAGKDGFYQYRLPDDHVPTGRDAEVKHVFVSCLGTRLDKHSLASMMTRMRRRGFPAGVTLYHLRHRFAFRATKNKVGTKMLSIMMGHKSTAMTEKYILNAGLMPEVIEAVMQAVYGPGAFGAPAIPRPRPIVSISPPAVEKIPVSSEHLPRSYGNPRPRPDVLAGVADVPAVKVELPSDPGELSVLAMMRKMMAEHSGRQKVPPRRPTSSTEILRHPHDQAYKAVAWAVDLDPGLAKASDQKVFAWLTANPGCPFAVPPTEMAFRRYLSAARRFYGTLRKRGAHRRQEGR